MHKPAILLPSRPRVTWCWQWIDLGDDWLSECPSAVALSHAWLLNAPLPRCSLTLGYPLHLCCGALPRGFSWPILLCCGAPSHLAAQRTSAVASLSHFLDQGTSALVLFHTVLPRTVRVCCGSCCRCWLASQWPSVPTCAAEESPPANKQ